MSIVFSDKSFVITGTFKEFERKEIEEIITSKSGVIKSSVSSKTDYLICGEKAGSKLAKAEELGITIISEEEFKNSLNNGENQMSENNDYDMLKDIFEKASKFGGRIDEESKTIRLSIESLSALKEIFNLDKNTVQLNDISFLTNEEEYESYEYACNDLLFISESDFNSELELLGIKNKEDFSKIDDRVAFFNKLYPKIEKIMEDNLTEFLEEFKKDWYGDIQGGYYFDGYLNLELSIGDDDICLSFKLGEFQNPEVDDVGDGIYKVWENKTSPTLTKEKPFDEFDEEGEEDDDDDEKELPNTLNEFLDLLTVDDEYLNTNDFISTCAEKLDCYVENTGGVGKSSRRCIVIDNKEYGTIESIDDFISLLKTQQSKKLDIDSNLSDEIFDKFCENHRDLIEKAYELVQSFLNGEDF